MSQAKLEVTKRPSMLQQMIEESTADKDKCISITIGSVTLLFTRLTDASMIYKIQVDAMKQCKLFKKMPQFKDLLKDVEDMIICKSIVFADLNINDEKQTFQDFVELSKQAGDYFSIIDNTLDFLMKPQTEIEAELIGTIEGNSKKTSIIETS